MKDMTLYQLGLTLNLSNNTRAADRWTAHQWLRLYRAYATCDWDYTPCQWSPGQLREALRKTNPLAPQFDENGPIYPGKVMK